MKQSLEVQKIKFKNEPEWPLLENEQYRQNLSYASVRPPLYKIKIDEQSDDPEEFYLAGKFSDFLAKYPAVNVSLDCPAAVSDIIYLGALRHVSQFILEELKIGLVLSARPTVTMETVLSGRFYQFVKIKFDIFVTVKSGCETELSNFRIYEIQRRRKYFH